MAISSDDDATTGKSQGSWRRWSHPRQKLLLFLSAGVMVSAFMPWLMTAVGDYPGFAGPGRYVFYAGVLGLGAGVVPVRWLAFAQGAIMALTALVLPIWQVADLLNLVGFKGWFPGMGMILLFGTGMAAAWVTSTFIWEDGDMPLSEDEG